MSPMLSLALQVLLLVVSMAMLWKGADWFVDSAVRIARRFNVSELVIGLTLVGFGTSAPEFAVSIGAALEGRPDISVGNVVGSNIFNLGFILGGTALVRPILTSRRLVMRDGMFLIAVTLLLSLFISDLAVSRLEGVVMMGLLTGYLLLLFFYRDALEDVPADGLATWRDVPIGLMGLGLILGGSELLVESASHIARSFGMSDWVIGVTVVAAGTSAPELVTSLNAVLKGRHGLSAGNLIGSDLYNLLGVLGLAAFIHPMQVDPTSPSSVYVLVVMVAVVVLFMRTGWRVSRREGFLLVAVNLVRWVLDMRGGM